jgi:hypothetical protein
MWENYGWYLEALSSIGHSHGSMPCICKIRYFISWIRCFPTHTCEWRTFEAFKHNNIKSITLWKSNTREVSIKINWLWTEYRNVEHALFAVWRWKTYAAMSSKFHELKRWVMSPVKNGRMSVLLHFSTMIPYNCHFPFKLFDILILRT